MGARAFKFKPDLECAIRVSIDEFGQFPVDDGTSIQTINAEVWVDFIVFNSGLAPAADFVARLSMVGSVNGKVVSNQAQSVDLSLPGASVPAPGNQSVITRPIPLRLGPNRLLLVMLVDWEQTIDEESEFNNICIHRSDIQRINF